MIEPGRQKRLPRWAVAASVLAAAGPASADGVLLRSGAELRGEVVSAPGASEVRVRTLSGLVISADRDDVQAVRNRTPVAEEYVTRVRRVANTPEAHARLARWCKENRLTDQRREQYAAVLALDDQHEAANKALGRRKLDGAWMSEDEARAAEGLVQADDRWVSPEEAEFLEEHAGDEEARRRWFPVVREIERLLKGDAQDVAVALDSLRSIDDPNAAEALVTRLGKVRREDLRLEVVEALGRMAAYEVVRPLVRFAVFDVSPGVRQRALDGVPLTLRRTAADQCVRLLTSRDNRVVNRAGEALAVLGSAAAVPQLVAALTTTHKRTVRVLNDTPSYNVGPDGQLGMSRGPQTVLPADVARGLATGAYPFGVRVVRPDSAYRTKTINVAIQNAGVRRALVAITGADFGFDEGAWRRWWRTEGAMAG